MRNKLHNQRIIIETAVFICLLYRVSLCVYLNGDDFMYGTFAHTGIVANVCNYYVTGNGRFWINILDSALLWFDRYAFIAVLPWIVLSFVVLFAKTVLQILGEASDRQKEQDLIRVGMVLFACLDVMCLRETVFWITGMINYLFPAVAFLLGYLLFRKSRAGALHGCGIGLYYAVCFFTAFSVEQFALMFVGMMTLHHGYDLLNRHKIHIRDVIAYGISLVGLALLILAPGNFQRVDEQQMPGFAENLWSLVYQDTMHDVAMPYLVMLSLIGAWVGEQAKRGFVRAYMRSVPGIILILLCTPLAGKAIVLLGLIFLWLIQMAVMFVLLKHDSKPVLLFLCVIGAGSQIMLLVSAVWGFRCMLSLYLIYMLLIGCMLDPAESEVKTAVLSCGIAAAVHPVIALLLGTIYVLMKGKASRIIITRIANGVVYTGTVAALVLLVVGYARNVQVHEENLFATKHYQEETIVLKELPDETYSWCLLPMNEFHEAYYRQIHHIPENVQITYELQSSNDG